MPNLFRYILPFLILLTSLKGEAQVYPVQSTLQITPPYSLTLADYVAPGSEKVALNIFLADVNRPELSVRLRLRIEGVGIRIETKAEYLPEPMMISGGVPLRLIGADLVDYFDPRNLNFSGITQREYEQKAALPEGLYQFTFEVIEYNRGVKISNSATVMAWLILNDPPLINLPKDNDKIRIQSPQQVIFQWTPRHTGSPNAAFSTEYEFRLVEVWPSTRNPNDAILTSPAIFETTTAASTLIYGPAETPLEPGRRYAFRIKAKSIVGVDELNLFKNNGYSQVSTFVYGDACTLPTGIQAEVISSSKIGFAWDTQDNHTGYNIKYRLANTPNAAWYTNTSALNDIEINSLQPATTYEYQVAAACGSYESEYSPVATVTTNEAQAITYSCGLPLNPFDLDPSQLIESLKTGDVIQAGDFDVKLTEVSGSNGIFTGKGVIEVPFFNKARLQASFSSISVNKELRMVAGSMNITGGGVEVIPAGVMDLMDELTEALALADSALNLVESNLPQPFDPYSFVADKEVKIPGTITSVTKGANGGVVVTASNGTEQTIPAGGTTAITDSNGNGYLIDSKGNIHPTTAAIASAAARREYNLNVNFAKASNTRFGFDAKKHDALLTTYEHVKDTYYASWKSIATGQTDNALALLEGTNVDKTKIHFEQSGVGLGTSDLGNISQSPSPNSQILTIKGTTDGVQESVVALYTPSDTTKKEQVLGKLNVVTYNQIDKHVVIVPVNGNTFDKFGSVAILQDSLNKIYNQGIVNWTVELKPGITVEGIAPFEDGGTGLLSNFTSHMKKVINAYKENTTPDTYYLFLVSNPQDPSTLGVMPRSKEYGFIFADKHSTLPEVARTIAHELGHGAFNLHHTFMEPNYTITKGTTDNLMDYPAGPKLYKYQWDKIRYPDIVVGIFESDEEGQSSDKGIVIDSNLSFLTPSGTLITLPAKSEIFYACNAANYFERGTLLSFRIGDMMYYANAEVPDLKINFINYISTKGIYPDANQERIQIASTSDLYLVNQDIDGLGTNVNLIKAKTAKPVLYKKDYSGKAISFTERDELGITEEITPVKSQVFKPCDGNSGKIVFFGRDIQKISSDTQTQQASTITTEDSYAKYAASDLHNWLKESGSDANVILTRCNTKELIYFSALGKELMSDNAQYDLAREKYDNGTFDGGSAIWACWDGKKWNVESKFKEGVLNPTHPKLKSELAGIKEEIENRVNTIENAGVGREALKVDAGEDGEIKQSKLGFFELIVTVRDVAKEVVNTAKVPEQFWNSKDKTAEFSKAGIHVPALLAGGGDQVLDEAVGSVQFISFALDIATEPKIVVESWNKIKNLKTDDIKKMIIGAATDKYEKYAQGGVIARHEGGKDAVQFVEAVIMPLANVSKKAKDVVESADVVTDIAKKFDLDDAIRKDLDDVIDNADASKLIKECTENGEFKNYLEQSAEELKSIAQAQKKKFTWPELQALWKRGNDFNAKRKFDYPYSEVWLEHPTKVYPVGHKNAGKPRRYRLDSFDNVGDGKIVSRKATSLSEIQESTFENYLKELKDKYPDGSRIANSDIGKTLKGKHYLEIPDTNKAFYEASERFKQLAKDYDVTIVFKPE